MIKLLKTSVAGALCALALIFASCERNAEPDLNRVGWAYYPLKLGQFRLYDVYQINYNFAVQNDTLHYELKEHVADYFLNQKNDTVYIMHRFKRNTPETGWQLDSAYSIHRTPKWLQITANNRPRIHLMFPVGEGLTWNSNLLNALPADSFTMLNVGKAITLNDKVYENSLVVVQEDILDTIDYTDEREEVYAYGNGLVYKRQNYKKYCSKDCPGPNTINSGVFLEMSLKETGYDPQ